MSSLLIIYLVVFALCAVVALATLALVKASADEKEDTKPIVIFVCSSVVLWPLTVTAVVLYGLLSVAIHAPKPTYA